MRKNRTDSVKGYKIDFTSNRVVLNYKFAEAANDYGSPEYERLKAIKADFPGIVVVIEAGRKVTTTNRTKRLSYENMKEHIDQYENSEELIEMFEKAKKLSKPLASPYKYVRDWFEAQFENYKEVPKFENGKLYVIPVDVPNVEGYEEKKVA